MNQTWKQWEGQVLNGEFHLRQYLGGSENSGVFLTDDLKRGLQKAAVKLIPAGTENAELQFSQWKEAAKLSHPHLIRLFQMGRCQLGNMDLLYLEMEYAEVDMSQILPQGPFPPAETRETIKLILNALAYLHGEGFIHGRLKPSNVMSVDGQLKLSSDGICRKGKPSVGRGTPGVYDPPEAESGMNSPAGDIWSLGMILVEIPAQRPPVWVRTEEGDPVLPRTLPAPFFDIARNCLRWDPLRRWTVAEIRARLEPSAPVPKSQTSAMLQKLFAKRRYIVLTVAVGLALAAIVAGPKLLNRHRLQPKPGQHPVTRPTRPLTQKTNVEQQGSSGTRPSGSSFRSGAGSKPPTGGIAQSGVRQKILPDVPQSASDTVQGTIRVNVKVVVDPSGSVVDATLVSPGPSQYFARLALEAARRWKFWPEKVDGQHISNEWILKFEFTRTGTDAFPVRAGL
jgi:TonB family protein